MINEYDERPWGNYTVLDEGERFKVKRIEVLPEKRLSYQKHRRRAEHRYDWSRVAAETARVYEEVQAAVPADRRRTQGEGR